MKKCMLAFGLLFFMSPIYAQTGIEEYLEFWKKTDAEFQNPEESPLKPSDLESFDSVPRFPYEEKYRVTAVWKPLSRQKPFDIQTTTDRRPKYQKVGLLQFNLDSVDVELPVYRNLDMMRNPEYKDYLFVPFTDLSNGEGTYMGGRYLDMSTVEADSVVVDFNLAYNPYCVYNDKYSCPIPPKENHIPVAIWAGARSNH